MRVSNNAKRFNQNNAVGTLVVIHTIKYITKGTSTTSEAYTNNYGVDLVRVRGFESPQVLSNLRILGKPY